LHLISRVNVSPRSIQRSFSTWRKLREIGSEYDHVWLIRLGKQTIGHFVAFWLERNTEEFAPKEKGASVVNQVVVNPEKPMIRMDPETIRTLSEAYDAMRKEKSSSDN
jgi:hypothetical protein